MNNYVEINNYKSNKRIINKLSIIIIVFIALFFVCLLGQLIEPIFGKYSSGITMDEQNSRIAKWTVNLSSLSKDSISLESKEQIDSSEFSVSNFASEDITKVNEVLTNYYFVLQATDELDISKINVFLQYVEDGQTYKVFATNPSFDNKTFRIENIENPNHWHFLPNSDVEYEQTRTFQLCFQYADDTYSIENLGLTLYAFFEQIQ